MKRLTPDIVKILACPACHGALELRGEGLSCRSCGAAYPIIDGIPRLMAQAKGKAR